MSGHCYASSSVRRRGTGLPSAWTARAPGGTTSSSSGCGAASNTRRFISRPTTASARPAPQSVATWTSTTAADRIRALTEPHPIKPTSPRCQSAWQPNPGRRSPYRCGNSVQITGPAPNKGVMLAGRGVADHLQNKRPEHTVAAFSALSHEHATALMTGEMSWRLLKREGNELDGHLETGVRDAARQFQHDSDGARIVISARCGRHRVVMCAHNVRVRGPRRNG